MKTLWVGTLLLLAGCRTVKVSEKTFFRPASEKLALPAPVAGSRPVTFQMPDGVVLRGFWLEAAKPRATLIFLNGAGGLAEEVVADFTKWVPQLNMNILVYDYRGTGRSGGVGTIESVKNDGPHVLAQLRAFDTTTRTVLMGSSMGSVSAVALAAQNPEAYSAVVLDSVPTTVRDWVWNQVPWVAKPFVTLDVSPPMQALDVERDVALFTTPLLLTVGDADEITPLSFSHRILAASASTPKELHVFHGAHHSESPDDPSYLSVLNRFLIRALDAP